METRTQQVAAVAACSDLKMWPKLWPHNFENCTDS